MGKKKIPQLDSDTLFQMGKAERVQQSQIFDLQGEAQQIAEGLDLLEAQQFETAGNGRELIAEMESILGQMETVKPSDGLKESVDNAFLEYESKSVYESESTKYDIAKVREVMTHNNWDRYYENLSAYAEAVGIADDEDPFLTALGENEYRKLDEEINGEFGRRTSIRNKTDLKFLSIAIALEVAKGLLYPVIAEAAGYGESFDPADRLHHDDPSIKKEHKKANDAYRDKKIEKHGKGEWIEFLYRKVPYDITNGTGTMGDVNLHGGAHRLYTLGHDPILGWIFGTANILTDSITIAPGAVVADKVNDKKIAGLMKAANIRTYRIERNPMRVTPERISMSEMFKESWDIVREDRMNLWAAIFSEGQHLKSDVNTKMGLPIPALEVFDPDFASKLYSNNYDALCYARDMKIIGKSAVVSILIDTIIGLVHGLYYDPEKDGSRELYEVRTRKILLIANTIGTSSNLICTYFTKNLKGLDIGGLLVTLSHLFGDTRFILNVKKEFIENKLYEKIEQELKQLDRIEQELTDYGSNHRAVYAG